jgi:hypothetical protein
MGLTNRSGTQRAGLATCEVETKTTKGARCHNLGVSHKVSLAPMSGLQRGSRLDSSTPAPFIAGQLHCAKRDPHERFRNRGSPPRFAGYSLHLARLQMEAAALFRWSTHMYILCRTAWHDGVRRLFTEVEKVNVGFNVLISFGE